MKIASFSRGLCSFGAGPLKGVQRIICVILNNAYPYRSDIKVEYTRVSCSGGHGLESWFIYWLGWRCIHVL